MTALTSPWISRGTLVEAHLTANTTINVAAAVYADITGTVATNNGTPGAGTLQVTATLLAGRRYWLEFFGMSFSSVAADNAQVQIADSGGTQQGYAPRVYLATANFGYPASVAVALYPSTTGSVTYKIQTLRAVGTGNVNMAAASLIRLRDDGLAP